jgi:hypothetical protein
MPVTRLLKSVIVVGMLVSASVGSRHARAEEAEAPPLTAGAPPAPGAPAGEEVVACVRAAEDAQSQRSAHRLRSAFKHLLVCSQSNCPTVVRNDCVYWLAEVEKQVPSVIVQAEDKDGAELTDVSVSMDGEPLVSRLDGLSVPVDPGVRTFRFEHVGSTPIEQRIVIREGDKGRRVSITFDPRPPALPPKLPPVERRTRIPTASFVFGGIGAVALGSFAYFGLTGRHDAAELADGCGRNKTCSEAQVAPIRTKLLIADVSLGAGLVSLGAAAYLFFTRSDSRPHSSVSADVTIGRDGSRVSVRTAF